MNVKEVLVKCIKLAGDWLLDFAKKAWEDCLKDYLHDQIQALAKQAATDLQALHDSKEYEDKKKEILDNLFGKIELPLLLKPFKWLIKKILYNEVEERVQSVLNKLNGLV